MADFGEKDYQQSLVIKRLVADFNFPVQIVTGAIVRESDGLAMSSRNRYLDAAQRKIAPGLQQTLAQTREAVIAGHKDYGRLVEEAAQRLIQLGFEPDYIAHSSQR